MAADRSPYAALGLDPGADAAAVDHAYKRLIKQFHPDREGGDARRAAEINRAYRELRSPDRDALEMEEYGGSGRTQNGWMHASLWLAAGVLVLILVVSLTGSRGPAVDAAQPLSEAIAGDPMGQPIAATAVDGAINDALRIARDSDELALAETSRACHRAMHARPSLARLDRCAAFDDAVVQLQDRDPLRDRGPFSELAVTGRQMSAATLLSNDYLAIDGRLDRIRLQVELALAPRAPDPPPAANSVSG